MDKLSPEQQRRARAKAEALQNPMCPYCGKAGVENTNLLDGERKFIGVWCEHKWAESDIEGDPTEVPAATPVSMPSPTPISPVPVGLKLCRSTLVLNLLLGSLRMMAGLSFWWMVVQGYLLCILAACEFGFEPFFNKRSWSRNFGLLSVLVFTIWFSVGFVFVQAPLNAQAVMPDGQFAPGSVVHGLRWYQGLREVRVFLENPTDSDYQDIDIRIQPDGPLSNIAQVGTIPGVFFIGNPGPTEVDLGNIVIGGVELQRKLPNGTIMRTPLNAGGTSEGCRVRCPILPKNTTLDLSIAVGIAGDLVSRLPTRVHFTGSYVAKFRSRPVDKLIAFAARR